MDQRKRLRQSIDGAASLHTIFKVAAVLDRGHEIIVHKWTNEEEYRPVDSLRLAHYSKLVDIHFRLLGKVLPDLKAVELTGADGGPVALDGAPSERLVLATKVLALVRDGQLTLDGTAEPVATGELDIESML